MRRLSQILAPIVLLMVMHLTSAWAQTPGCTDPLATNFSPAATENDGSCLYRDTVIKPLWSVLLPEYLEESSGLILYDRLLWTHNDDTDTRIYGIDLQGRLQDSFRLSMPGNRDWEEIAQDDQYIYIGDFGNNGTGTREDLHILRVSKADLGMDPVPADTIWFDYALRDSSAQTGANNTDFDCEAFLVSNDSLYLFTKEWVSQRTTLYVLPSTPGHHIARPVDSLDTRGMVTGATRVPEKGIVVLCGYTRSAGQPFLILLYDHNWPKLSKGNLRKVYMDLFFHQIEAVEHGEILRFYLTNEEFSYGPVTNPAKLHEFDLAELLGHYSHTGTNMMGHNEDALLYPNPFTDSVNIRFPDSLIGQQLIITNGLGAVQLELTIRQMEMSVPCSSWPAGNYHFSAGQWQVTGMKTR